jgi:hypothetical protein
VSAVAAVRHRRPHKTISNLVLRHRCCCCCHAVSRHCAQAAGDRAKQAVACFTAMVIVLPLLLPRLLRSIVRSYHSSGEHVVCLGGSCNAIHSTNCTCSHSSHSSKKQHSQFELQAYRCNSKGQRVLQVQLLACLPRCGPALLRRIILCKLFQAGNLSKGVTSTTATTHPAHQ